MIVHIVHRSLFITKLIQEDSSNVGSLFDKLCLKDVRKSYFVLCNGKKVAEDLELQAGQTYHIIPRLPGGKGGFGSMLRAIGAQIEKTTSREACRDLSGRRMRDINNEKKLKEWLAKEADREREREERRQERLAKRLAQPQHKFDDKEYHQQKVRMQEDLQDAVSKGLKRTHKDKEPHCSEKRKKTTDSGCSSKTEWIGVDIDSDDLISDSDNEANPGHASDDSSSDKDNTHGQEFSTSSSLEPSDIRHDFQNKEVCDQTVPLSSISAENKMTKPHSISNHVEKSGELQKNCAESEDSNSARNDEPVDLECYGSAEDLAKLGMERLKNALMTRGLKCGGTLEERAERLFSVKGLAPDDIDPSLYAKAKGKGKKSK